MLDNLTNRFSKVLKNIRGRSTLTEDNIKEALREVRLALLEADVIPTFLRLVTGSLIRVPNLMMATNDKGCARCGT